MNISEPVQPAHAAELLFKDKKMQISGQTRAEFPSKAAARRGPTVSSKALWPQRMAAQLGIASPHRCCHKPPDACGLLEERQTKPNKGRGTAPRRGSHSDRGKQSISNQPELPLNGFSIISIIVMKAIFWERVKKSEVSFWFENNFMNNSLTA